ncbi:MULTISPECIES: hypothetical protein [unclassified Burkholderia]|uniref:hypothetical protein n=1 Tax=unclassified Burkholderia TaxID=2613784 RepID=UPI0014243A3F|nr:MULTISPECIES: hypothetical protein [unclassified Burkholderia]NIE87276.1 hypothetical protein [Burkholderia sp. Tr-860]NIF65912.1 hypothetical protein [Burkholderia sp. Cy-647]NIF91909.1 hypothetical protein [Burkholderia sp. Cy-637]NIF99382.1 hypothetical protein [Burkholderia sp. Ax-1720]
MSSKKLKVMQARRDAILAAVRQQPGVTTKELADIIGTHDVKPVSNAMWRLLRSGNILSEQVTRDGAHMNAYYLPEQIDGDSVERVNQKLVDASDVVPVKRAALPAGSVFELARKQKRKTNPPTRSSGKPAPASANLPVDAAPAPTPHPAIDPFTCAIASDGSLVLMRAGRIELALSDADTAILQRYLVKRIAANTLLGDMAG